MRFKFVHAADLHLGSPFRGLRGDATLLPIFREATFVAFRRVVSLCLAERADFLVLAGDLFDARDRSVRALVELRSELGRLHAAGIQTFIVHGNHDPLPHGRAPLAVPPSTKVFGPEWEEVSVVRDGRVLCRIQGISYPTEQVTENLAQRFRRMGPEPTVGVVHTNVGGDRGHANYAPCTLSDLAAAGMDYWALGHVHTRAQHTLASGALAVYPGNTQGRHVREAGERGCVVVMFDDGRVQTRFEPVDSVRWHRVEVSIADASTIDELAADVESAAVTSSASGVDANAVRVVLTEQGFVRGELEASGGVWALEDALRRRLAQRAPPILLESIDDQSSTPLDLDAVRAAGGLLGTVLEVADEMSSGAIEQVLCSDDLARLDLALRRIGLSGEMKGSSKLVEAGARRVLDLLATEEAA